MSDLEAKIAAQAEKVRALKAAKAPKDEIKAEVGKLLGLKAEAGIASNSNSNSKKSKKAAKSPKKAAPAKAAAPAAAAPAAAAGDLQSQLDAQAAKVRALKSAKAPKAEVQKEVQELLRLKSEVGVAAVGEKKSAPKKQERKEKKAPAQAAPAPKSAAAPADDAAIKAQSDIVKALKAARASQPEVKAAVEKLIELMNGPSSASPVDAAAAKIRSLKAAKAPQAEVKAACLAYLALQGKSAPAEASPLDAAAAKIRSLKAAKAPQEAVKAACLAYIALKNGGAAAAPAAATAKSTAPSADAVKKQTDKVRALKAKKAPREEVKAAVEELLELKAGGAPDALVNAQKEKVRALKAAKAPREQVKAAVEQLLALALQSSTSASASAATPAAKPAAASAAAASSVASDPGLDAAIAAQGDKVRQLKAAKASKEEIKAAVAELLALKAGGAAPAASKKEKNKEKKDAKKAAKKEDKGGEKAEGKSKKQMKLEKKLAEKQQKKDSKKASKQEAGGSTKEGSAGGDFSKVKANVPAEMVEYVERAEKAEQRLRELTQAFEKYIVKGGVDASELQQLKIENATLTAHNAALRKLLQDKLTIQSSSSSSSKSTPAASSKSTTPTAAAATTYDPPFPKLSVKAPKDAKGWLAALPKLLAQLTAEEKALARGRPGYPGTHWINEAGALLSKMSGADLKKAASKTPTPGSGVERAVRYLFTALPLR